MKDSGKPVLVIRADASTQMGTGHIMRCLALAQAWREINGAVILLTVALPTSLAKRVKAENVQIEQIATSVAGTAEDAQIAITYAHKMNAQAIVVDGYQFNSAYQKMLKKAGCRTLFIDDYGHCDKYVSDWVLNQNVYASETLYPRRAEETQLRLGTKYTLLRREFWPWRHWQRPSPTTPIKLLVTLGGGDSDNITLTVIEAIKKVMVPELQVVVLVGGSNPHYEQLNAAIDERIELRQNVTDMPQLMAWADVAISAGGSTCWELAFMGLPNLILILADNQRPIATTLHNLGGAINLGWGNSASADFIATHLVNLLHDNKQWRAINACGKQLVDGFGAKHLVEEMLK